MPFIRLSDNYIDHPKFLALSAAAFRLWHEGMAFCRKHQTDGVIPFPALNGFRYFKGKHVSELLTPYKPAANPLWKEIPALGYSVHDYLEWNPSKEEEQKRKADAVERTNAWRRRKHSGDISSDASRDVYVPDRIGEREVINSFPEKESEEKPRMQRPGASIASAPVPDGDDRAVWLLDRYGELFTQHRLGAKYFARPHLDLPEADRLIQVWDNARLEKLAALVLTTDDPWISKTDRSFKIFAMKATWADDKLRAWEIEHGVSV